MDAVEPDPASLPGPDPAPAPAPAPAPIEPVEPVEAAVPAQSAEQVEPVEPVVPVVPVEADPAPPTGADLVEMALASVELSPEGLQPATGTVSLLDMQGGGRLDIVMARPDALLVQEAMAGTAPPRPRTHDLLLAAVDALGGAVVGVTLVERRPGGVYVAVMRVRRPDGSEVELDARPSDALNVALRSTGAVLRADRSLVEVPAN